MHLYEVEKGNHDDATTLEICDRLNRAIGEGELEAGLWGMWSQSHSSQSRVQSSHVGELVVTVTGHSQWTDRSQLSK